MATKHSSTRVRSIEPSPIRRLMDLVEQTPGVIGLHVGEPDFETPAHIKEAAKRALDEGYTRYTSMAGLPELREAMAEKLNRENGVKADPETEITVTVGSYAAIFASLQAVLDLRDEVIIPEPSWPSYAGFVKLAGGTPIPISLKPPEYSLNMNALEKKISEHTKLVIINTPNNPTGAVYEQEELAALASLAKQQNFLVLSDEVYEKITFDGAHHCSIASLHGMKDLTVTVNSFSKTYAMTGWRVGYVMANKEITSNIRRVHSYMVSCVSPAFQKAALTALISPQDCVREMVKEYKKRRDTAAEALNEILGVHCIKPKGTFYLFPDIQEIGLPSEKLAERLLKEAKVATIPGSSFGESGEGHLRISIATSLDNITEAIKRIKAVVKSLR